MGSSSDEAWPSRRLLITARLRQRRGELGLTQQQVVTRLAHHGLHTTNRGLSSLEHGAGLDAARLPALAQALECTVTYLVGLTEDRHRWEPDKPAPVQPRRPADRLPHAAGAPSEYSLILGADVPDRGNRLDLDTNFGAP